MLRRTKILATLGPSTDTVEQIEAIIKAGTNVVRMNFSHGTAEDHINRAKKVRIAAKKLGKYVAILGDLQGPKIRVAKFVDGSIILKMGDHFILDADMGRDDGHQQAVGIDYKALPQDVINGDLLLLDDGRIQLKVTSVEGNKVHTEVTVAGKLSNNKGINRQGGGLSAEALTAKDKEDIVTAAKIGVDYLAVSFPRSGDDLRYARQLAEKAGCYAMICAKVERAETVASDEAIDDIIEASDAVMVARGDLGVEIGDAELVGVQKKLIARSRQLNKVVITATQMMESMITSPMPTRAEVMDVANAVLDGTDAVMLSAETAAGDGRGAPARQAAKSPASRPNGHDGSCRRRIRCGYRGIGRPGRRNWRPPTTSAAVADCRAGHAAPDAAPDDPSVVSTPTMHGGRAVSPSAGTAAGLSPTAAPAAEQANPGTGPVSMAADGRD